MRASLIHTVRGCLVAQGFRLRSSTAAGFVSVVSEARLPDELEASLEPLIAMLGELSERIGRVDELLRVEARLDELVLRLQTVPGVGPIVSLAFIAWMDRPERFARSHDVGACLGLRPRLRASGGQERHGRITREGDSEMRRLLVQAAHAALHAKPDSELKRWGQSLVERVGTGKAVVALARKIGVLLHHLWVTGESFEPFPGTA